MVNNFEELTDFLDKYKVEYTIHSDCVEVKGDLRLECNKLTYLPESFGNLKIGGSLYLFWNKLTSLPESFGNLEIGRSLHLDYNDLIYLSESFGNLKIGGSLYLEDNKLTSLPDSFFTSKLYKIANGIKNLRELHSNFLKRKGQEEIRLKLEAKAKKDAEEQEEMIRFKSQIWVI